MKLLFVEDEPVLLEEMVNYFSASGNVCEQAGNFDEAMLKINSHKYDGIVVDITLPDGSGMDLIPTIRLLHHETGIMIVSAKNSLGDKIDGLNLGADDYLTKPFYLEELNARINALYRRKTLKGDDKVKFDSFLMDPARGELLHDGYDVNLTKKEFQLLVYFTINKNRVVGKAAIAEHIWGDSYSDTDNFDAIYVHLKNLRKKLIQVSGKDYIKTVWGLGYKFSV